VVGGFFVWLANNESTRYFAELTRQFILENGIINTEQGEKALLALLRSAPEPQGGFSFDNLNRNRIRL
jgi:hypothetical protein